MKGGYTMLLKDLNENEQELILKKRKPVCNKVNIFCKAIDKELEVVLSDTFSYEYDTSTIAIDLFEDFDEENDAFTKYLEQHYKPTIKLCPFVWSLLHEIGHHQTLDYFFSRQSKVICALKRLLIYSKIIPFQMRQKLYFSFKEEKLATKWAIHFAEKHKTSMIQFNQMIEEYLAI